MPAAERKEKAPPGLSAPGAPGPSAAPSVADGLWLPARPVLWGLCCGPKGCDTPGPLGLFLFLSAAPGLSGAFSSLKLELVCSPPWAASPPRAWSAAGPSGAAPCLPERALEGGRRELLVCPPRRAVSAFCLQRSILLPGGPVPVFSLGESGCQTSLRIFSSSWVMNWLHFCPWCLGTWHLVSSP